MAELSKTARASMKAGMGQEKKETNKITPEEAIRQIRMNLDGNLHNPSHLVRMLLEEYDKQRMPQNADDIIMAP